MPRKCGTCSACCRWPSVKEIDKPPRVPCQYLESQGFCCTIYADRPKACSAYNCTWMRGIGSDLENRDRPDSYGVLIDRRWCQYGHVLVAKSLTPKAALSKKGQAAIMRAVKDSKMICVVLDDDDDTLIVGACGSQKIIDDLQAGPVKFERLPTGHDAMVDRILGQMGLSSEALVKEGLSHGG